MKTRSPVLKAAWLSALALLLAAPVARSVPAIDGNLQDLIDYGAQLQAAQAGFASTVTDKEDASGNPVVETIYTDLKFIPCTLVNGSQPPLNTHWANGAEIFHHYLAYEAGSTTLYLGLRTEGFIGDTDGNGNPDDSGGGACNPNDNIEDTFGISGSELYSWQFDLDCNGVSDGTLRLQENQVVGTGSLGGVTATFAFRENAAVGASGHDLEIAVQLPSPLPAGFSLRTVDASAFDGLTEDRSDGRVFVLDPDFQVAAPAATICPAGSARLTLEIRNIGPTPLSLQVSDLLPEGIVYAGNLASDCNVGAPLVAGGLLTFPAFDLAPRTDCSIAFDVEAPGDCPAGATHALEVVGLFTSPCISEGGGISPFRSATGAITCRTDCTPSGLCRITGGGCLNEDGSQRGHRQSTFGGNASPEHAGGGPTGNEWQHLERDGRTILFKWHSHDAHVTGCTVVPAGPCSPHANTTRAEFVGTGTYSMGEGAREFDGNMTASIVDHREGSCNRATRDEYSIVVRDGLEIGQGEIVFQTSGSIACGNLQIHETPARLFGDQGGVALPGNEAGASSVVIVDRAYPNPFAGSTTFNYRVADAGTAVSVGVYDVAGRVVKTLAAGVQPEAIHEVTWDGSDDAGVRMAPGVYFLRVQVGAARTVHRLIYVSR
jgi:hypothetical protein